MTEKFGDNTAFSESLKKYFENDGRYEAVKLLFENDEISIKIKVMQKNFSERICIFPLQDLRIILTAVSDILQVRTYGKAASESTDECNADRYRNSLCA